MRLGRIQQVGMTIVDAAVNHGHANAGAVVSSTPRRTHVRGRIDVVVSSLKRMVQGDVGDVGIAFQCRQAAGGYRKRRGPYDAQRPMELGSVALHPGEVPRSWSLLELHDHSDKLIFAGRIGASGETCHFGRDLLEHSPVSGLIIPRLREPKLRN